MHQSSQPSILYFGTPVVLISSENENGSYNLAPISSVFWLGWRCIIGIGTNTKTAQNLKRTKMCVLNLPSVEQVHAVNKLALLTGCDPVPERKRIKGYRYEPNKFETAGLHPMDSEVVAVPSVKECPVQMEAIVTAFNPIGEDDESLKNRLVSIELKIIKVRLEENILFPGDRNHVDPDKWRPLIMSFQQFYGLGKQIHESALAQISEHLYKT
ncbi:flavin reductase family protein [Chryseolinea sp. H1M3-3]|uniref:flavin reductase family protein n=1 Tax=Chryseolinea sp. H1M3-3 TaxID=3034144 RepID=UPI0023ED6BAD|nr:flavin reductase family protein [Chryseolinea sp. H1M3-3]